MIKRKHLRLPQFVRIFILVVFWLSIILIRPLVISKKDNDIALGPSPFPTPIPRIIIDESLVTRTIIYNGINIKNVNSPIFNEKVIRIVTDIIEHAPQALLDLKPTNIYFVKSNVSLPGFKRQKEVGVSIGLDIYIFPIDNREIPRALFHEWAHIVQHYKTIQDKRWGQLPDASYLELERMTPFLHDYATKVGWSNPDTTTWSLANDNQSQKQTAYGKTHPEEDQAESISLFLTNQYSLLSNLRIEWVKNFLNSK